MGFRLNQDLKTHPSIPGGRPSTQVSRSWLPWRWLLAFLFGAFSLTGCELPGDQPSLTAAPTQNEAALWRIEVYFTNPDDPNAGSFRGGPDAKLAEAIDQAQVSVDMAILEFNLWSLRDALLRAQQRGVEVRLVTDSDSLEDDEIQDLKEAGIPVVGDRREGLMHNKFVVIDGQEVWTGSVNYTTTDGYFNNNHLVRLFSRRLAENYSVEFNEMFEDDLFGPDIRAATPNPYFQVNGIQVENYFSPDDGTAKRLAELLSNAQESIHFLAFSFTSDPLANVILERAEAGVTVSGVFETSQATSNIGGDYQRMLEAGLDVHLDGNPRNMHHKLFILDEQIVVIGSYNFSSSAETRNDENTIILHDAQIAALFAPEFEKVYNQAQR
jgi:phosphatidylserine/phosphatidylglycerophosphate/cardiolipin synthase-like enzyme